jgi:hypothetical protein
MENDRPVKTLAEIAAERMPRMLVPRIKPNPKLAKLAKQYRTAKSDASRLQTADELVAAILGTSSEG